MRQDDHQRKARSRALVVTSVACRTTTGAQAMPMARRRQKSCAALSHRGHSFRYMPSGDNPGERLGYAAQHWAAEAWAEVPGIAMRLGLSP